MFVGKYWIVLEGCCCFFVKSRVWWNVVSIVINGRVGIVEVLVGIGSGGVRYGIVNLGKVYWVVRVNLWWF